MRMLQREVQLVKRTQHNIYEDDLGAVVLKLVGITGIARYSNCA